MSSDVITNRLKPSGETSPSLPAPPERIMLTLNGRAVYPQWFGHLHLLKAKGLPKIITLEALLLMPGSYRRDQQLCLDWLRFPACPEQP